MNIIKRYDRWLLDEIFQKISDWTQVRYNKNNYWWAKISIAIQAIAAVWLLSMLGKNINILLLLPLIIFVVLFYLKIIKKCQRLEEQDGETHTANPHRLTLFGIRIMTLITKLFVFLMFCFSPNQVNFFYYLYWLSTLTYGYFISCTPLPLSRIKEKLRKIIEEQEKKIAEAQA